MDVAKKAKVSPSTVSRVIHDHPRISKQTKERVKAVMQELGYHPNAAARSLVRGKSQTIGLIIPNSEEDLFYRSFFIMAMRGISIEAQNRGYNIMYSFSSNEDEEVEFLSRYIHRNLVDGIILMVSRDNDRCIDFLEDHQVPYAVIGHPGKRDKEVLWVDNDNFRAMYNVVSFLFSKGCTRPAFLGGPAEMSVTRDRLRGYKEALRTHGIIEDSSLIIRRNAFTEETGYRAMEELVSHSPDSVAAADDLLALGALEWMRQHSHYLPIVGFNNTIKASLQKPGLSSVDIRPEQLGAKAAELLIANLQGEEPAVNFSIVDTKLIERDSSQ